MTKCSNCSSEENFDAKQAYEKLSKDYVQLADIVADYMSQAGIERSTRNHNALEMSNAVARIIGGRPVGKGEYPECCLIGTQNPNTSIDWFCTGVLIHPRVVLTAAHCSVRQINAVALNCEDEDVLVDAEIISTYRPRNHPSYSSTGGLYDISVLILKESSNVPPVEIALTEQLNQANKTTLVGFGTNNTFATNGFGIKREAEVDITHIRRSIEDDLDVAEIDLDFESDLEFVAGGGGIDSCKGDSGGPAYIMIDGNSKLAGLTSRLAGRPTRPCGDGGVYTRVDKNFDFVKDVARQFNIQLD